MAIIAAILVNIAIGLLDFKHYRQIYQFDHQDAVILAIVAFVTFLTDPVYGILAWVSISLLWYIKRNTESTPYVTIFRDKVFYKKTTLDKYITRHQHEQDIIVIKFVGEINFINMSMIQQWIDKLTQHPHTIFSMSGVSHMDLDGVDTFNELISDLQDRNIQYHITGLSKYLKSQLQHDSWYLKAESENRIHYATADIIGQLLQSS